MLRERGGRSSGSLNGTGLGANFGFTVFAIFGRSHA